MARTRSNVSNSTSSNNGYQEIPEYKAPTYKEMYGSEIANLADKVANRQAFDYDYNQDQAYQSLAKTYGRLGNRAREDTMADYAAMTGGMPSSAAVTAGLQAQNDYNQQLTDKIPALMEAAYSRYRDDYEMDLSGMQALQGLEDSRYSRFATDRDYNRGVYESNRDYRYGKYRDTVADSQWRQEFNWQKVQDNRAYQQWKAEFKQSKWNDKKNLALEIWKTKGKATSFVANVLGVPKGATTESYYFNDVSARQAASRSSSSSGSGGGSRSGGGSGGGSGGNKYVQQGYYDANKDGKVDKKDKKLIDNKNKQREALAAGNLGMAMWNTMGALTGVPTPWNIKGKKKSKKK